MLEKIELALNNLQCYFSDEFESYCDIAESSFLSPDSISHLCVSELILSVTPQVGGVLAQGGLEMGRRQVR